MCKWIKITKSICRLSGSNTQRVDQTDLDRLKLKFCAPALYFYTLYLTHVRSFARDYVYAIYTYVIACAV
jgi:hypothetical protein